MIPHTHIFIHAVHIFNSCIFSPEYFTLNIIYLGNYRLDLVRGWAAPGSDCRRCIVRAGQRPCGMRNDRNNRSTEMDYKNGG